MANVILSNAKSILIGGKSVATIRIDSNVVWEKNTLIKLVKPTLTTTQFMYTGSTINVKSYLSGYDSSTMTLTDATSKSSLGSYTFCITPKIGYCWSDGSTLKITYRWNIYTDKTIIDKPSLNITRFDYTGSTITATDYLSVQSDIMTISGTTSATSAGTYTFSVTPSSGYCWSDGSTSSVSYSWEILAPQVDYIEVCYELTSWDYSGPYEGGSYVDFSGHYEVIAHYANGSSAEVDRGYLGNTCGDYSYEGDQIIIDGSYEGIHYYIDDLRVPTFNENGSNDPGMISGSRTFSAN